MRLLSGISQGQAPREPRHLEHTFPDHLTQRPCSLPVCDLNAFAPWASLTLVITAGERASPGLLAPPSCPLP